MKSTPSIRSASRHSRLIIALLAVSVAGIAGALVWHYFQQRAAVEQAAIRELQSVAEIESIQIDNWRRDRLGDGGVVMALSEMQAAERLLSGTPRPGDRGEVMGLIAALQAQFGYSDISLVDNDGAMYVRLDDHSTDSSIRKSQRGRLARQADRPTLSDIGIDRSGARLMTLTVPVRHAGAFILQIDPKTFLDPYLRSWRSANHTGETYLVRYNGDEIVYLTELRYGDGKPFHRRSARDLKLGPEDRLPESFGLRGVDYHGALTMGWARRVPGSPWFLVAKMDVAEIDSALSRLAWELTGALALIAFAMTAGIGWIWKGHQLRVHGEAEERLRSLNAELASNLEEKTAKEAEIRALGARILKAQEEERRRLSRELHDDLSQQIAALSIGLGNLKRAIPPDASSQRSHCEKIQQRVVEVSESVRRMSHELHPSILRYSGLAAALRGYCGEFEGLSGIRIGLRIDGEFESLPPDVSLAVFRIAQESLRNIGRHAQVEAAEVELARLDSIVRLIVADRGVGLPANRSDRMGLGLVSMRERTRLVNGTLDIESAPGQGTRVTVTIPVDAPL